MRTLALALSVLANLLLLVANLRLADRASTSERANLRLVDEAEDVRARTDEALTALDRFSATLPALRRELSDLRDEASHL